MAQRVTGRAAPLPLGETTRGGNGDTEDAKSPARASSYHVGVIELMVGSRRPRGGLRAGAERGLERPTEDRGERPDGGVRERAAGEFRRLENHRGPEAPWGWATDFVLGIWVVRENGRGCGEGRRSANGTDMRGAVTERTRRRPQSTEVENVSGRKIVAPRSLPQQNNRLTCRLGANSLLQQNM